MHTHWALPFARTVIEIWEQEAALNDDENTHSKIICHDKIIYAELSTCGKSPHLPVGCKEDDFCKKLSETI